MQLVSQAADEPQVCRPEKNTEGGQFREKKKKRLKQGLEGTICSLYDLQ